LYEGSNEPFIQWDGMKITKVDDRAVMIETPKRSFQVSLVEGNARWILGRNEQFYWWPYPALKAYPIELELKPPESGFQQRITYRISIVR